MKPKKQPQPKKKQDKTKLEAHCEKYLDLLKDTSIKGYDLAEALADWSLELEKMLRHV